MTYTFLSAKARIAQHKRRLKSKKVKALDLFQSTIAEKQESRKLCNKLRIEFGKACHARGLMKPLLSELGNYNSYIDELVAQPI